MCQQWMIIITWKMLGNVVVWNPGVSNFEVAIAIEMVRPTAAVYHDSSTVCGIWRLTLKERQDPDVHMCLCVLLQVNS